MGRNYKTFVGRTIEQAKKRWKIDPAWEITWAFTDYARQTGGAFIDPTYFTEKRAHIELDETLCQRDLLRLKRNIYHEIGHIILAPVWRGASDFADHFIKSKKVRLVYEEQFNTRENEIIDHIISQIFGI